MTIRFDVEISLALGADLSADPDTWSWTDITDYCLVREGGVFIRRGRDGWQDIMNPARAEILVNNADGRFTRLNPSGAWYGSLGINAPLRIRACATGGALTTRFVGFVSELPPRWEPSESHFWVPLRADGVLRRLGRRTTPLRSSVQRLFARLSPAPLRYWSMEDGSDATRFAEFNGGPPMTYFGDLTLADDAPPGSAPLPTLSDTSGIQANIGGPTDTGEWVAVGVFKMPAAPAAATAVMRWYTAGNLPIWQVVLTPGSPDTIALEGYDAGLTRRVNASTNFVITGSDELYGTWVGVVASAQATSSGVDGQLSFLTPNEADGSVTATNAASGYEAGALTDFAVNPSAGIDGTTLGHVAFWDEFVSISVGDFTRALNGWANETASARFLRLLIDESVPWYVDEDSQPLTQAMGPRRVAALLDMLAEAEAADAAQIAERLTGELGFYSVQDRINQDVALALDYDLGHIKPMFDPTDDDAKLVNDVTVTRSGGDVTGSSAHAEQVTGPLGTDPETGAGRYEASFSLNLYSDAQTVQAAGWRLNLGTVDEYRYPQVHLMFHSSASLLTDWLACDLGSRVTIDNMPANMPPDRVDQVIEGYTERINQVAWDVVLNLSPYKPYRVFELATASPDNNEFAGRLAGDEKCALRTVIDDNDLSIVFDPNRWRWETDSGYFDPDIPVRLGGEVVEVSAIATTAATYVAAGAASHADNAAVSPSIFAGATAGDWICVVGRIRGTAGSLATPTDYTLMRQVGSLYFWVKVHDGSESAPTLTPSGGSAGDTVSGFTFGLRGMPTTLDDLTDAIVQPSPIQRNTSAQNIGYGGIYPRFQPGCVVLLIAGKSDDWTSVAVPSGMTEIAEPSTTTGSDQGLYAAYQIQTTPAVFNEGSLAVTGGASAVSESMLIALAGGYQTMTVSARSVNGVVRSHAVGTRIAVEDPMVMSL